MPPLALVGNLSYDLIDGQPPRIGGAPLHCARGLRALGAAATIVARCAPVDEPRFRRGFAELGLPVTLIPGTATTTFSFTYDGDRRVMRVEAVGDVWSEDDVSAVPPGAWVHVGGLLCGDFAPEAIARLARGRRLSLDGQGVTRSRRLGPLRLEPDPDPSVLRHVTILKLAEEEAEALAGSLDGDALAALGPPEVLVTFGSRGSLVVADGRASKVPAHAIDADPTGSGDVFAAGYLAGRAAGLAPVAAARRATALVGSVLRGERR
ncbi:MAG TPA: PfkB family carbohydrate kinase [Gaiellaceae bacterium]|nr:PfkB family carbohydrate kinase [Gaiellaceae bacterium]